MAYILTGVYLGYIITPVFFGGFLGAKISQSSSPWDESPKVSALHLAAASGDLEAFQEMIKAQAGGDAVSPRFFHG